MENERKIKKKMPAWLIVLIVVLGIGVLSAAGYYGGKYYQDKKAEKAKKEAEIADPMAGWNTYLNDQLYFTFKYPTTWTYEQTGYTSENWTKQRSFGLTFKPADFYIEVNPWTASASPLAHVYDYSEKVSTETVKLDGADATREVWQTTAKGKEIEKGDFKAVDLKFSHGTDKFTVHFRYNVATETAQFNNYSELIKTWKFTQAGPVAKDPYDGWKTYTDEAIGYSLRYPANWSVEYKEDNDMPEMGVAKYIVITTANGNRFYFGLKKAGDESFRVSNRTGIGAGEDIAIGKETTMLGETVIPKAHVWEGKTKEYFFPLSPVSGTGACKCDDAMWFDPPNSDGWDTTNTGEGEIDTIDLILASVKWL